MTISTLLALVHAGEFALLPPLCLAIALVTSAAHREDMRGILRHALRAWLVTLGGIILFMIAVSVLVGWILP
ncbi:MAG TPA: hypothetical protein VFY93_14310 [Planctomycetota bacterium]|nr:hypothetical protein [Planctomycetota bacterium]